MRPIGCQSGDALSARRDNVANEIDRREFVKQTVVGSAVLGGASVGLDALQSAAPPDIRKQVIAKLGPVFVPSRPNDPGYAELEPHGITDYVLEDLRTADGAAGVFNTAAQ